MNINVERVIFFLVAITLCKPVISADDEAVAQQGTSEGGSNTTGLQEPAEENWYGTLERFNKHPIQVKYKITQQATGTTNAQLIINKETFALDDFTRGELDNKAVKFVRFRFKPGGIKEVECLLILDDSDSKGYSGLCPPNATFDTTGVRRLTMHRASGQTESDSTETGDESNP